MSNQLDIGLLDWRSRACSSGINAGAEFSGVYPRAVSDLQAIDVDQPSFRAIRSANTDRGPRQQRGGLSAAIALGDQDHAGVINMAR